MTTIEKIANEWGEEVAREIAYWAADEHIGMSADEFFFHCYACGGDWSHMLLTGIKALFPNVYDAIPDYMGDNAFFTLCDVLELCGVKVD